MRDADARRSLRRDLERFHCRVHQPDDPPLFTREPRSAMEPVHWRWAWHGHKAAEDAVVFEVNDTPAMKALGYYREQAK